MGLLPAPPTLAERIRVMTWAKARGLTRAPASDRDGLWGWFIPSVCPQLDKTTNKCGVYDNRPDICRNFDGKKATDLDCLWKGEV
jgi:Fe-S-cluster containining protein